MTPDAARKLALKLCRTGGARYLDCLNYVINKHGSQLPCDFVEEVRTDYLEYANRMTKAGLTRKPVRADA